MATLTEIRDAIKTIVETNIAGLKVCPRVPGQAPSSPSLIVRPAAVPADFDEAMGKGLDRWDFDLIVVIGYGDEDIAQKKLDGYVDGGGASSIRAVIFANKTLGQSTTTTAHVSGVIAYGPRDDAGYDHVSATLRLTVYTKPS